MRPAAGSEHFSYELSANKEPPVGNEEGQASTAHSPELIRMSSGQGVWIPPGGGIMGLAKSSPLHRSETVPVGSNL